MRIGISILLVASLAGMTQSAALGADSDQPAPPREVTFTKDVAPILQLSCQICHRPGSIAPMSLLTYQDARPWARAIKEKVVRRQMPPWHIDRSIGITKFKDDPSLTDAEIATISNWVDQGALEDPSQPPSPSVRPGNSRQCLRGVQVPPEGVRAQVRDVHPTHGRRHRTRSPSRPDYPQRWLLPSAKACADFGVSAPLSHPRQGPMHGGDLSGRSARFSAPGAGAD